MKIQDLVFDVIVENFKSKAQFDRIVKKWYGENPTPEQIKRADDMLTLFMQKQKSLEPTNPNVYSFLTRFDGTHSNEFPIFDPKNLKDAGQYTLSQMESLYDDLKDDEVETEGVFAGNKNTSLEKVLASYNLWKGDEYKIIDEGSLRVYYIPDQRVAMQFGYYVQAVTEWDGGYLQNNREFHTEENKKQIPFAGTLRGAQWCVTGRGGSDSRSNMWGSYRNERTFYFVIDESKAPNSENGGSDAKHYLGALQVQPSIIKGYRITNLLNDGDWEKTWEEVLKVYPQLENHKDKFVAVKFDTENELENRDVVSRINETEGNRYEFRRVGKKFKKAYIDRGGVVSKANSWRSMPEALKQVYIIGTTDRNVLDKFQSTELMQEIRKKPNDYKLLNHRLQTIGLGGVAHIYDNLMKKEFQIARTSFDNPNFRLYQSLVTKKYGLFNAQTAKWVEADGIVFEPSYNDIEETSMYIDDEGNTFLVEIYSEIGEPSPTSLYCIYPVGDENEYAKGHFITAPKFETLKQKIRPAEEGSEFVNISDFNPETDVDIKEMKKGL